MRQVAVNKSEWGRGSGSAGTLYEVRNRRPLRCCLGFFANQVCEKSDLEIESKAYPNVCWLPGDVMSNQPDPYSRLEVYAIVNDDLDIDDDDRIARIKELGLEDGIDWVFTEDDSDEGDDND